MVDDSRSKTLGIFLIVIVVIFMVGFIFYTYLQSETGQRQWTDIKEFFKTWKIISPQRWLEEQYEEIGTWETAPNKSAEKIGVVFKDFEPIGGGVVIAGDYAYYHYVLDAEGFDDEIDLDLVCKPPERIVGGEIEVSEARGVSNLPHSYANLECRFKTKEGIEESAVVVKGGLSFPFTTKTKLKVYFITLEEYRNSVPEDKNFFEAYNLKEKLPIRSEYNNEPLALALVTALISEEIAQPVIIAEQYRPIVGLKLIDKWGEGKIKDLEDFNLYLPPGIKIKNEEPSTLCPFPEDSSRTKKGNRYEADSAILRRVPVFGGKKDPSITFKCNIDIDESIAKDPVNPRYYYAEVSYTYEYDLKSADAITIEKLEEGL